MFSKKREKRGTTEIQNKVIKYANMDDKVDLNFFEDIGLFSYKSKELEESVFSRIYLADFDINNSDINNIYDETGKCIAVEHNEKGGIIEVKPGVELDVRLLKLQILKGRERKKYRELALIKKEIENLEISLNDKEPELDLVPGENLELDSIDEIEPTEETEYELDEVDITEEQLVDEQPALRNWKNEGIKNGPKIVIDEIINGLYLWEILEIDKEIEGRIPKNLNSKSFRTGFLSIVDSKELTAKDGKERKAPDTFVVINMHGDMIELDEPVLEPQPQMTMQREQESEIASLDKADGKVKDDPKTQYNNTRTSLYKIPGVYKERAVSEDWYLSVDWNEEWKNKGTGVANGNTKEISFVQQSRNVSYLDRKNRSDGIISTKLEAVNEGSLTPEEEKQQAELRKFDGAEAEKARNKSLEQAAKEIANEIYEKYKEIYNINDLQNLENTAKLILSSSNIYQEEGIIDEKGIQDAKDQMSRTAESERVRDPYDGNISA